MNRGDSVQLTMEKVLRTVDTKDKATYACTVLEYDTERESICLLLETGKLTDLSLDAIYSCNIQSEAEQISCTGRICDRYHGKAGKILEFQIKSGFYKINLKSVDKQIT